MLNALRRGAGTWVAKIFLGLLVLSFAVWGIADIFTGYGTTAIASVGDRDIEAEEYRRAFQLELQQLGERIGRPLSIAEARALGIDGRVLSRLLAEATLDEDADHKGLGVSEDYVAQAIVADPTFQDGLGGFSRANFERFLQANGIGEARYVRERAQREARRQIGEAVAGDVTVPGVLVDALRRFGDEARVLRYLVLTPQALPPLADPDEVTLASYYEANLAAFRAPEYRRIGVLTANPESVAASLAVPEEEIAAAYERQAAQFQAPERRALRQIVFDSPDAAQAARAEIEAGRSFEEIASGRGLSSADVDLGLLAREEIIDPAVAEAAFATEPGEVSQPVQGRFGTVLIAVDRVEPAATRPLEEVRDEIRNDLALRTAQDQSLDLLDQVEDDRAGGSSLQEIANNRGLQYREVAVDRQGRTPEGEPITDLPIAQDLLVQAFETDVGIETDPLQFGASGNLWFDVLEVTPARDRPLDEVRDEVLAAWRAEQTQERLRTEAESLVQRLQAGESLDAVAGERGQMIAASRPLRRSDTNTVLSPEAIQSAFARPEGGAGNAPTTDGTGRVVFVVSKVVAPQPAGEEGEEALRQQIAAGLADDLVGQYVVRQQERFGAQVNQGVLQQTLGLPAS